MDKNLEILMQAHDCYVALESFRRERERNKRYHYGDQWSDIIVKNGTKMPESQLLESQGSTPLKNNLIRRLVRNVIGVYEAQALKPMCKNANPEGLSKTVEQLLDYNADINRLPTLYMRTLEEFLISGMAVHRKWYGELNNRIGCWTDYVSPTNVFFDANMRDFRAWDCNLIGEIHDISFPELCLQFANSVAEMRQLKSIYGVNAESACAFFPQGNGMLCRVIEVWRKEVTFDAKAAKLALSSHWHYYFLSPSGHVLRQGRSPYRHGAHPYVIKAYPLIDGEIHSFVSDVIDQQRYTNRLISMYDWMVRSSAKGVLLLPSACIPDGVHPREMADVWSKFNGVMVYASNEHNDVPRQVANTGSHAGISELLSLQMKFFEDISGVNGALQGNLTNNSMSARLFNQQTQNATTALSDVLLTFNQFVLDGAYKDLHNMCQFFSDKRVKSITGSTAPLPHDIEYDLYIAASDNLNPEDNKNNETNENADKSNSEKREDSFAPKC